MVDVSRCAKCVLPRSTPGIRFDEQGVCNYCRDHRSKTVLGESKLMEELERHRSKTGGYDCLVSISGGRDSTYALLKAVKDYGLKVLATNYRNPFTSEQAKRNMEKALEILGVECISWEFPNDIHRKDTASALKTWAYYPSSVMIPIICSHCKAWWPSFFRIAKAKKIPLILIGSNPLETASFKKAGLGGARTYHKVSALPRLLVRAAKELARNPRYLTNCSFRPVFKAYFMASHSTPYLRWRYKDFTVLRLFDYIVWNEQEVVSRITHELAWEKSPEVASSWRFDCRLDFVRRLMYEKTVGVSELQDLFSKLIRQHQMSREEALNRLKVEDVVPKAVVNDVLSGLGMTLADLNLDK